MRKLDFEAAKKAIDMGSRAGEVIASVVCSTYWGTPGVLKDLSILDSVNFEIAVDVMAYRHEQRWDDEKFWALAKYALNRLGTR